MDLLVATSAVQSALSRAVASARVWSRCMRIIERMVSSGQAGLALARNWAISSVFVYQRSCWVATAAASPALAADEVGRDEDVLAEQLGEGVTRWLAVELGDGRAVAACASPAA